MDAAPSPSILDAVGRTPLVELRRIGAGLPVPLLAKCEHLNPGGSVKDRIAVAIVDAAERSGALEPGATLVEATAGNTGIGLALVAAVRGYRLVCVLPEKMSVDKREALAQVGAEVIVTENAPPDGWFENDFDDEAWSAPTRPTCADWAERHGFVGCWFHKFKYTFYRINPAGVR